MWLPAALKHLIHPHGPMLRGTPHVDVYGWHMPHYAYGHDRANCQTCGTDYPCRAVRHRARRIQGGRA